MKNIKIILAILPKKLEELEEKLILLKEAYQILGLDDKVMVQIDICNEEMFNDFDFSILDKYLEIFDFEFDLMNINTDKINERLNGLANSGFNRIIFHIEDWNEKFSSFEFENFSSKIGLALIPKTPTEKVSLYLDKIDFVQFMGIDEVGYQGSSFNPEVIEKIREFRKENPEMIISVDGGVNLENAKDLIEAGANRLVSGSSIFGENNSVQEVVESIKRFDNLN